VNGCAGCENSLFRESESWIRPFEEWASSRCEQITKILTCHVVPGTYDSKKLTEEIKKAGGSLQLKTVAGEPLTFTIHAMNMIKITDAKGGSAMVTTADVYQSNGVVHVIDTVLMP
jgi:uncharacterized surface protein with fasciclin (FAS1) repeats